MSLFLFSHYHFSLYNLGDGIVCSTCRIAVRRMDYTPCTRMIPCHRFCTIGTKHHEHAHCGLVWFLYFALCMVLNITHVVSWHDYHHWHKRPMNEFAMSISMAIKMSTIMVVGETGRLLFVAKRIPSLLPRDFSEIVTCQYCAPEQEWNQSKWKSSQTPSRGRHDR